MRLVYTPEALDELEAIADYIKSHNPWAAQHVRAAILASIKNLATFPFLGKSDRAESIRKIGTKKYPYIVYYRIDESYGEIVIITIQHGARDFVFQD